MSSHFSHKGKSGTTNESNEDPQGNVSILNPFKSVWVVENVALGLSQRTSRGRHVLE